ncbi:targeting protein for Xklp2 homolog [Pollicipes pollicipes]|uniref:targeting protein for Xklp2 homolog n=1 Tax=Pollicipes pollicipes TaxID=41117 RepID=UPI0018852AE8|nr:targeting protein for Xklp2 homolog [Pollicipes pollicipes]
MNLEFNAPMFCDFTNFNEEEFENADVDSYFEVDHEAEVHTNADNVWNNEHLAKEKPIQPIMQGKSQAAPKNLMSTQSPMRPAGLRDVTNSPRDGVPRSRPPLKRANALGSQGEPCAKQSRSESVPATPPSGAARGRPDTRDASVPSAVGRSGIPTPGGRRRSMSQNDAARAATGLSKLVVAETPNVLRRGLQLRAAARAAAEQAVEQQQQARLDTLRKQMADYKKKAAEAKRQPVRARQALLRPVTEPQPFHLHDERQTGGPATRSTTEFKSMAQMVEGFYRKTPPRFHTRPAGERPAGTASTAEAGSRHVTVGHTPALMTRSRTRSLNVPSREQLEEAELELCRQQQVRARPVNRRVLEQPVGVPAKLVRPATTVEPFQLTQVAVKPTEAKQSDGVIRANPILASGVPFIPKVEHKSTQPTPFSFEARDKQRQQEKERKIQQVLEEERRQREFRAQLLPPPSPHGVPERRAAAATLPQPFQLPGEQLTAAAAARRQKKLEEEAAQLRTAHEFRAQPCTVTSREPFRPRSAARGPTAPRPPQLHTERRSTRRQSFEERQKQREAELQAALEERQRQQQLAEEEEVARARREAVHHAQPVRRFRPVHVQPSDVPLTDPRSPKWHADSSRISHRSD